MTFNFKGDTGFRHNISGNPHLDIVSGVFFVIGFLMIIFNKHIYYTLKDIEAKLKSLGIEKFVTAYDLVRDKLFYKADCNLRYYYAFERNLGSNGKVSYLMSQVYDS